MLYESCDNKSRCLLCPNGCVLAQGQFGKCGVRMMDGGKVINPYLGVISSASVDPIEKKPLYHYYPGSYIYSIGFFGCTLHCQFCKNYSISQISPAGSDKKILPQEMVQYLIDHNLDKIAFTYSEPLLYYEWVLDVAQLCKSHDIKTVLVTNGYINHLLAKNLLQYIDAVNVDLKSASDHFYNNVCSGKITPVKDFITTAYNMGVHTEVTTLVIPNNNDNIEECVEISQFLANISPDIPYHISRYFPAYRFIEPPTPRITIDNWVHTAKNYLKHVYPGNI